MPRMYSMSYEGPPANRWVKMYQGVRYRVSCEELGAMMFTKEATWKLANEWWEKKLQELEGRPERIQKLAEALVTPPEEQEQQRRVGEALKRLVAVPSEQRPLAAARMEEIDALTSRTPPPSDRLLPRRIANFLSVVSTDMKPLTFREIRLFIRGLTEINFLSVDVGGWNAATVERMYLHLKHADLVNGARHKRWGFFRRFVRYLWEKDLLLVLPKNLDSTALTFDVRPKKIKRHPADDVRKLLGELRPKLRLYAFLGLNCGMTSVDVGQLLKAQVDAGRGRLIRKKVKTGDYDNVPTVEYVLWPETLALLEQHWSDDASLVLTSEDGTPMYTNKIDGEATPQKDLITQQWKRAKLPIKLKDFRSIAAGKIEGHKEYGRYVSHFLGHSLKSLADKHYAAPSAALFDELVLWLRQEILG